MAGKLKSRKTSLEWFKIKVTATAANISHRGRGLSGPNPDGDTSSVIEVEGTLDRPVLKRDTAFVSIFCGAEIGDNPGGAVGATTTWRLVLWLPREQFVDLLTIVAARRLAKVGLLLDGLKRGKGAVRSASFDTEPLPSERNEDTDDDRSVKPVGSGPPICLAEAVSRPLHRRDGRRYTPAEDRC